MDTEHTVQEINLLAPGVLQDLHLEEVPRDIRWQAVICKGHVWIAVEANARRFLGHNIIGCSIAMASIAKWRDDNCGGCPELVLRSRDYITL